MKKYLTLLTAGAILLCALSAFGCGTTNETTRETTPQQTTTEMTTERTTTEMTTERTTEMTTDTTETTATDRETDDTSDTMLDPMLPLPDIDDPITDVEPNIPESGVGDNGGVDDIFDGSDMTGNNGTNENGGPGADIGARGGNRRDANASNPALPTK